jgi:hypothetical protein
VRPLSFMAIVAAALSLPLTASAQTTAYVCTPDAQVIRQPVNEAGAAGPADLWYTGGKKESFNDCVVGPDGWLYIASGSSVLRLNLSTPTATGGAPLLALVGSAARGLAFNVNTLYVNTASTGVYALQSVAGATDPLTFPNAAAQLFSVTPSDGHGVAFDILGNMILSSGGSVLKAPVGLFPPLYPTAPAALLSGTSAKFATAVNTCGEVVFADKATRSVASRAKDGSPLKNLATFSGLDYPVALEIDSNNNIYVATAQSDAGAAAKLWRIGGSLENHCAAGSSQLLLDVGTLLSAPTKVKGLLSNRGLGVAISPTDASLTHVFNSTQCSSLYDFGYHTLRLTFADCAVPFSVTIDALKSKPTEVNFNASLGSDLEGIRYSPLGGYAVQYVLNDRVSTSASALPPSFQFNAQYGFYTQEPIGTPGIARVETHGRADAFTENVLSDFWDLGILDAASGERGNDFSKRVLFNSPLASLTPDCAISPAAWEQPLNTGNPLFNSGQNIKVAFTATLPTGAACGGGGTMHVSVVRTSPLPLTVQVVQPTGNGNTGNVMSNSGDRYFFNLDTSGFVAGTYLLTVWGDKLPPTNKVFTMTK